jgi:hypothetical protein
VRWFFDLFSPLWNGKKESTFFLFGSSFTRTNKGQDLSYLAKLRDFERYMPI